MALGRAILSSFFLFASYELVLVDVIVVGIRARVYQIDFTLIVEMR